MKHFLLSLVFLASIAPSYAAHEPAQDQLPVSQKQKANANPAGATVPWYGDANDYPKTFETKGNLEGGKTITCTWTARLENHNGTITKRITLSSIATE